MLIELKNEYLTVGIETFGAEIRSVKNSDGFEYMWNADEKYWKRTAPVLFPFVGSLRDKKYEHAGKTYEMGQHGFARDMEFKLISHTETSALFGIKANADTLKKYPFDFSLKIGYELVDDEIKVIWNVINEEPDDNMYFSIGAHPAFMCPTDGSYDKEGYGIRLHNSDDGVLFSRITPDGLMKNTKRELKVDENGYIPINNGFFSAGVYIIEGYQANGVSLVDKNGNDYLTVNFDAPLFGIWSPDGKDAPFICIEPWYGRCDRETFTGTLRTREYTNTLKAAENWKKSYTIVFHRK